VGSTLNFEDWLANNAPGDMEAAYCLFKAASEGQSMGIYDANRKDGRTSITGPSGETLVLVSPKAHEAFLKRIEGYNLYPDLGWEGAYEFTRQMAKKD
jgi:hypothetical protein